MQISDDLYLGNAYAPNMEGATSTAGPSPMSKGVGPMGRVYIFDLVPLTKQTSGLATAQAVSGAGNLTLTAGTGVTTTVDPTGTTRYVLDCARCIDAVSSDAGDTTQTITFYGYDIYGNPMSQLITLNGTTRVATLKAFKSIYRAAISATCAGNISVGFTDTVGLPVRVTDRVYTVSVNWNNTLARDTGTLTVADTTSPATTATGDVRGTYALSSASDGSKRLVMCIALPALACGPNSTTAGAFGVTQV
jgi:hypothetical protein